MNLMELKFKKPGFGSKKINVLKIFNCHVHKLLRETGEWNSPGLKPT